MNQEIQYGSLFAVKDATRHPVSRQRKTKFYDYDGFVKKFEPKMTTDDCYTPQPIYAAVVEWLRGRVDLTGREIVRPFWPGGDYERFDYPKNCVVIDNPPFSIISRIARFYTQHGISFFLFAPNLTLFSPRNMEWTGIICNTTVTYENGARVNTAFISNLFGDIRVMTAPDLARRLAAANEARPIVELPKYAYPDNVTSAALLGKIARHVELVIRVSECRQIMKLDSQGDRSIYGGGLLLSDAAAARKKAAERAAEEATAAIAFELSDRERRIIESLG